MIAPMLPRSPWLRLGLYLSGWGAIAAFFATETWLYALYAGRPLRLGQAISYPLVDCAVAAALAPAVFWMARRFPFERGRIGRALGAHLGASLLFAVVATGMAIALFQGFGLLAAGADAARLFPGMLIGRLSSRLMTYAAFVVVAETMRLHAQARERELRASRLEARLVEARLEALKAQLHPHFLFNTLHAISTLMHRDVEAADRVMARLGDLLRMTLEDGGAGEVALARELAFLDGYLEIQRARLGGRLRVAVEAPADTLEARVPNLVLQPLVENAIRHGIAPRTGGGRLEVRARRENGRLWLEVRDDGPGLPAGGLSEGIGIANTRARLAHLYGDDHRLELANQQGGGLRVTLEIPFRAAGGPT